MIFWNGEKIYRIIRDAAMIEGAYFPYKSGVIGLVKFLGGGNFTRNFAIIFKSKILIYEKTFFFKKVTEKIPIVSEFEKIENFPDKFAIKTKNIDLLRELISRGKKVCWYDPDLFTQAHFLGILNFEHVFLNPYINTHVILPSGDVALAEDYVKKSTYSWVLKGSVIIGFHVSDVKERINWSKYNRNRYLKGQKVINRYLSKQATVNLYNIFSLTYLIWRQSKLNVTTVTKKTAIKE